MIGDKVGQLAKLRKIKQDSIADNIGVSRVAINRFFNNKSVPSADVFCLILKELNIDIHSQVQTAIEGER